MEESELISQLINGDKNEAFRSLMRLYKEKLYWHIRKMVFEHEDADDILQETFIKIYKGIGRFRADSSLYTWLYRIATNETLRFIEKKKKRSSISNELDPSMLYNKQDAGAELDGSTIELKLKRAIGNLPEQQKLVFNMRYFEDMSYEQIAKITGKSTGGLKANYHHAVKKIEIELTED